MPARKAAGTQKKARLNHVPSVEAPENRGNLHDFPVVGIGASAGGLEAFTGFLHKVPVDSGMAFVLIQHMDPSQPSRLTELLGRASRIPVREVEKDTRVEPDHVYVISPGSDMIIRDRTLRLQPQPVRPSLAHGIDIFFRSLAEDAKEQAIAIILSGTASDGTDGARAVKAGHGLVIVQDPESAKYDGMPRAAIDAGVADYVLKPEAMADQLIGYRHQSRRQREETHEAMEKDDTSLRNILSLVRARTGHDFSGYKVSSITRRIGRRMSVNRIETSSEYLRFLKERPAEIEYLMKDFLINVTAFFRDKEAFGVLKREIDNMFSEKPEGSPIRAWIPGCSTGEEAYSLAMLLVEGAEESKRHYDIQVFGTDLDTDTITFARAGLYPAITARDVGEKRLEQFFNRSGDSYHVKKNIREKLIFAVHDIVSDPPYSRMDIVSVRNLLIYFDTDLQKKIIPRLHYSLNEGGLLFLGTAETIGETPDLFTTVDSKWRIYRAVHTPGMPHAVFVGQPASWKNPDAPASPVGRPPQAPSSEQLLLEALPPSIIVNSDYKVIYTHGNTSKYLHLPEGNPSSDLLGMVDADLRLALTTALHEASQQQKEVSREGLRVKHNGETQSVKLKVRPLSKSTGSMIVTFEDLHRPRQRKVKGETLTEAQRREMDQELQTTRETLRGTIEELETANEELRSTNEEYMSTNEELRSANEELETSREELRSVNEELTTVNTEREKKIEELTDVSDDMRNLLNSTAIATIFLDERLRIRRFTPVATTLFNFINTDVGRPVEDISSRLKADGLAAAARQVLETLIPVEQDVQTEDGRWYSMRVHPYRTSDNAIEGVVASFIDINQAKAALSYAQGIVDTVREPLLVLSEDLKVISASRAFYRTFGVSQEKTEGQFIYDLGNHQWDIPQLRELLKDVLQKDKVFEGYQVEHRFPGVGRRLMLLNARRFYDSAGATQSILLAMEDVTHRPGLETPPTEKFGRKELMSDAKYKKLRRLAEARLAGQEIQIENLDRADLVTMAHELAVHQIELEIQNEELRESRVAVESARDLYLDLYDFAPVGYLTLDEHSRIVEANLAVSQMLMETRGNLLKKRFTTYIHPDDSQTFHFYQRKVMENEGRHILELKIQKADGTPFDVQLISIRTVGERFRVALMDITERKNSERELQKYREHLEELVRERTAELHQSEQNFRNSIENSPLGIRIATTEGVTLYANRSLLKMYGCNTLDELKNKPVNIGCTTESYAEQPGEKEKRNQGLTIPETYHICTIERGGRLRYLREHRGEVFWDGRPGLQIVYDDITERRRAQEKLKALSQRLLQVQEDERRAMALELHDEIGQSLNALKLLLGRQIRLADGELRLALVSLSNLTGEILEQVRQFSLDLRPRMLDDLGLLSALVWYFHRYTERTGIRVQFEHSGLDRVFSSYVNTQVYRVVQEALTNVSRHAAVDCVAVQAEANKKILLVKIEDKGSGFDMASQPVSTSVGLEGMRERIRLLGGSLTIDSAPERGTRLVLRVPLEVRGQKVSNQARRK